MKIANGKPSIRPFKWKSKSRLARTFSKCWRKLAVGGTAGIYNDLVRIQCKVNFLQRNQGNDTVSSDNLPQIHHVPSSTSDSLKKDFFSPYAENVFRQDPVFHVVNYTRLFLSPRTIVCYYLNKNVLQLVGRYPATPLNHNMVLPQVGIRAQIN